MITFLETPYRATNRKTGFEILVHGFVLRQAFTERRMMGDELFALCVDEDGVLHEVRVADGSVVIDWRFDRKQGWHQLEDVTKD